MPKVKIINDSLSLDVNEGSAFIDICAEHDTSIFFSCRAATCGTCMIRVVAGPQNLSPMENKEKEFLESMAAGSNVRLACQCKVLGDVTVEVEE